VVVLSWLGAIVACLGYGVASVLQSVAAKRAAEVVGLTGLALIIKQVPYLIGLAADGLGFLGNVLALQRLPLFLVQSIVAGSVGVTAVIASLRGGVADISRFTQTLARRWCPSSSSHVCVDCKNWSGSPRCAPRRSARSGIGT